MSANNEIEELRMAIQSKAKQQEREKFKTAEELMDMAPDLPADERGDAVLLRDKVLPTGRLKGTAFQEAYLYQKGYVEWVRQNVKSSNSKFTKEMLEFRLYVACRDTNKKNRLELEKKSKPKEKVETPRTPATRRTATESDWEEVMNVAENDNKMAMQLQMMQERLESIDQVIRNAQQEKQALAHQMGQMQLMMKDK